MTNQQWIDNAIALYESGNDIKILSELLTIGYTTDDGNVRLSIEGVFNHQ